MAIYNATKVRYHGMAVNYHGKIFYNIGQKCIIFGGGKKPIEV
jgi:hypothetical protein